MGPSKTPQLRLLHIRDEIDGLGEALRGISFEQYQQSYTLRRTAERAIQIVSEAAKSLPSEVRGQYPDTPWSAIIGIGNVLRHDYQHLDDRRLWEIITVHLPALRPVVLSILTEIDGKSSS
jgi:uncharacterized protein with HEPN domain